MAVSSSYGQALDAETRSIKPLLKVLGRFSGSQCPPELLKRFSPQERVVLLGPNRIEIPKGLRQLETSAIQYKESSRLKPPDDSVVDVLDTVLPWYHLLFGSLMVYRRLAEQTVAGTVVKEEALGWFAMTKGFLGVMEGLYGLIDPRVRVEA